MNEALLARPAVQRVVAALAAGGSSAEVKALGETARTAADAARALGCAEGAIVKSLVFRAGEQAVMALVAGDRQCNLAALRDALDLPAKPGRADAGFVKQATGFTIGGVAPLGHPAPVRMAIDASLGRFPVVYAAAGHPHCVFPTTLDELARLTGAPISAITG